ncbi:hypothetical protein [Sediminispirochaeta bajacaliforniensis]|uniref:hypothetical protein n=1 Tax=Sediminispirochaeta bajacaliforniensis TaxID=148 RepID=UPI00036B24AD|nr:hypothetical protein [Sediminispirochaeta bajacaliforniensis]
MKIFGRMAIITVGLLFMSVALFANGTRETVPVRGVPGSGLRFAAPLEQLDVEGTLVIEDGQYLFRSGGKLYTISAPGYPRSGFLPKEGTTMEIEADLYAPLDICPVASDGHLIVRKATVDGREYDLMTASRWVGPSRGRSGGYGRSGRGYGMYRAN